MMLALAGNHLSIRASNPQNKQGSEKVLRHRSTSRQRWFLLGPTRFHARIPTRPFQASCSSGAPLRMKVMLSIAFHRGTFRREQGKTERLVEKSLSWCRQNSKMILFQQGRTLPLFWNGLQGEPWTQPFSAPLYPYR